MFPAPRRLLLESMGMAYPLINSPLSNVDALSLMGACAMIVPALLVITMQPDVVDAALRQFMYGYIRLCSSVGVAGGAPTPCSARAQPVRTTVPMCDAALSASSATVIALPAMTPDVSALAANFAAVRVAAARVSATMVPVLSLVLLR